MMNMRQRAALGLAVGDLFSVTRKFSSEEIASFSELSRDYNPVHCDSAYAELKGMKSTIAHGLLTASLMTEIGGQIGWLAASMSFRFKRPVYPDESLTCDMIIKEIDEKGRAKAEVTVININNEIVLEAETTGVVPIKAEKQRLVEMLAEGDLTNGVTNGI